MDREILNRANEITNSIALLNNEICDLGANPTVKYVKTIQRAVIPKACVDVTIVLSKEDINALKEVRRKKIAKLEEELKRL